MNLGLGSWLAVEKFPQPGKITVSDLERNLKQFEVLFEISMVTACRHELMENTDGKTRADAELQERVLDRCSRMTRSLISEARKRFGIHGLPFKGTAYSIQEFIRLEGTPTERSRSIVRQALLSEVFSDIYVQSKKTGTPDPEAVDQARLIMMHQPIHKIGLHLVREHVNFQVRRSERAVTKPCAQTQEDVTSATLSM